MNAYSIVKRGEFLLSNFGIFVLLSGFSGTKKRFAKMAQTSRNAGNWIMSLLLYTSLLSFLSLSLLSRTIPLSFSIYKSFYLAAFMGRTVYLECFMCILVSALLCSFSLSFLCIFFFPYCTISLQISPSKRYGGLVKTQQAQKDVQIIQMELPGGTRLVL